MEKWNLESLYSGVDAKEFLKDMKSLEQAALKIKRFTETGLEGEEGITEKLKTWTSLNESFLCLYSGLHSYASFRFSTDVRDREAEGKAREIEKLFESLSPARAVFTRFIREHEEALGLLEGGESLKEYEFYFRKLLAQGRYCLSPGEEAILATLSETGGKAWERMQSRIAIQVKDNIGKLEKKESKKEQFDAELLEYSRFETVSASALNNIKQEVIAICKIRGYESPLQKTLMDCHMDPQILDVLIKSVEESLPDLQKYYKIKAKILGYHSGLPYYERETPLFHEDHTYSFEEAKELVLGAFEGFSGKMYAYGKRAFSEHWIDYGTYDGKNPGASCDGVYAVAESRIRMKYYGSLSDVNVLAHELGHGYHNSNLFQEGILNDCYDLPIAETASKFSELIFKNHLKKIWGEEDRLYLIDFFLSGFVNTVTDIQSRFYFENEFFTVREKRELGAEEIKSLMIRAQKKSYGDSLDENLLHPYMWMSKPHYYFPDRNYYNFPYTFGALLSIGMYQKYEENSEEFRKNYDVFLRSTGKKNVADLCLLLGIDVKSAVFWKKSLGYITGLIEEFERELP